MPTDSIMFTPSNKGEENLRGIRSSEKELEKFFWIKENSAKHHRQISSINPIITETNKYRDEYDISQEELIENFISWK